MTELETLKRRRSLHDDEDRIRLLSLEIEKRALSEMAAKREQMYRDLENASANVRRLQAAVRSHQIEFGEYASKLEAAGRIDEAKVLMRQIERWAAGSMPSTAASIQDILAAREAWKLALDEMLR